MVFTTDKKLQGQTNKNMVVELTQRNHSQSEADRSNKQNSDNT